MMRHNFSTMACCQTLSFYLAELFYHNTYSNVSCHVTYTSNLSVMLPDSLSVILSGNLCVMFPSNQSVMIPNKLSAILPISEINQPRPQGLLLDDFQNGGSSGEDPGTQQKSRDQFVHGGWKFIQNGGQDIEGEDLGTMS